MRTLINTARSYAPAAAIIAGTIAFLAGGAVLAAQAAVNTAVLSL